MPNYTLKRAYLLEPAGREGGGYHKMRFWLRPRSRPMVGRPTVRIPLCMELRTVMPVTVEIIVMVFQRESVGYVTTSVRPRSSESSGLLLMVCEWNRESSISAVPGGSSAGGIGGADCISKGVWYRMMRCGDYGVRRGIIWGKYFPF